MEIFPFVFRFPTFSVYDTKKLVFTFINLQKILFCLLLLVYLIFKQTNSLYCLVQLREWE